MGSRDVTPSTLVLETSAVQPAWQRKTKEMESGRQEAEVEAEASEGEVAKRVATNK